MRQRHTVVDVIFDLLIRSRSVRSKLFSPPATKKEPDGTHDSRETSVKLSATDPIRLLIYKNKNYSPTARTTAGRNCALDWIPTPEHSAPPSSESPQVPPPASWSLASPRPAFAALF